MLKAQRQTNRPSNSKQTHTLDFRFSNFQALQVPKGWDRLFVSLISVETGKTIAKLSKALVKNGTCQWTETLSEPFHISRDIDSSKGHEDCLVKLLVSSGSTRSNILGETSINVAHYAGSKASAAVSQPLKKCSYGTILQVKVQRLTSRSKTGDDDSKKSKSDEKDQNVDRLDLESVSYRSDKSSDSSGKPLKKDLAAASGSPKLDSKEGSESASVTFYSSDSQEEYTGRENSSFKNGLKSEENSYSVVDADDSLNQISVNSRLYMGDDIRSEMKPKMNAGSSRKLLEVAEDTIEELRAEAKMWERNARKLMVDLDVSRNELSKLSKKHAEMRMELSAAYAEQDGLKREVESLVLMRKELENEIKHQQDMNDDLGQQLKRSQESNAELVSVLQELEETVGEQRIEIKSLSSLEFKYEKLLRDKSDELSQVEKDYKCKMLIKEEEIANLEATLSGYAKDKHFERSDGCNESNYEDLVREMESLREKVEELEKDCTELTDENLELLLKLKDSNKTGIRRCPSVDSVSNVYLSDESVVSDPKFQNGGFGSCEHFSEILKQIDVAFDLLKKPWHVQSTDGGETNTANKKNAAATEMSPECIVSLLQELNKLLEMRTAEFDELMRNHEIEIRDRDDVIADARKKMEDEILEVQQLKESKAKGEENYMHLMKEFDQKRYEFQLEKSHLEQDMEVQIQKLKDETSIQISNLQRKSKDESRKLEDMNSELERENRELHEKCSALVDQLHESKKSLSNCTKRVRLLEDRLASVLEEFEFRENSLKSNLEALIKEDSYQKDKLAQQVQSEAELRVQDLTDEIAASKRSHERLNDEHAKILKLLANYKKSEEKLKADLNDLELKHTISNYEREQLTKETAFLKMQLQNMSGLHDEILMLKSELKECRVDKGRMEIELHNISGDYEELKAENVQLSEKMSEFEECKRIKLHLEEKLLEMDKDLAAKEILGMQNADLMNELMETKKANMKIQQKMYGLEEDRDEWLNKAQALEENLKMMVERNNIHNESVVTRERYERTKSSLETELIDLRERYLETSLKYAEVESQREDLVMKLRAARGGKRWFL